jgi:PAS domain S-box-containing protein
MNEDISKDQDLIDIIRDLKKQNSLLKKQVEKLKNKSSPSLNDFDRLETINNLISQFVKLDSLNDIYHYVTYLLNEFLSDTVILFNSVDEERGVVKLESISGIDNKILKAIIEKTNFNPIGKQFKLIHTHDNYFRLGKLVEFPGKLEEFAKTDLSPFKAKLIQKIIGLHKIYTIGIIPNKKLLAIIHLFTFNKKVIDNTYFIDIIANIAGILIQKKITDNILKENEIQFRNLFENSPLGIYRTSPDGKILLANKAFLNIFGFESIEELQYIDIEKDIYTSPFQRLKFIKQIESAGHVYGIELDAKRKDGSKINIRETATTIFDNNGNVIYYEGIVEDITEKKLADLNLKISKESYFDIFNSVSEAIYIQNPETGEFIDVNKGAVKIYECSREELIGQTPMTVAAPGLNNIEQIWEDSKNVFRTGIPIRFNFWAVKKTGAIFPKEVIVNKGKYFGKDVLIATARDITETIEYQEKILFQSKFQQILIEISSSYINMPLEDIDSSTNNLLKEISTFFGASRGYIFDFDQNTGLTSNTYEWCNLNITPQKENLQNIKLPERWVDVFKSGNPLFIYDVMTLPEGYEKEILKSQDIKSLIAVPMLNSSELVGFIGLDFNENYHQYSEGEYKLLSFASQILVNIKLRMKMEKELIMAKEKAEQNDRLKSAFLANISHEIRTPMNGILGFTELLKDNYFDVKEKEEFIEMIQKSGERMLNIINDIINISKIESGVMDLEIKETNINKSVDYIFNFFKPESKKKNLELIIELPLSDDLSLIKTDEEKLIAVLTNLMKNALKFTEKGYIKLGYNKRNSDILFYVIDTGIGISEEKQELIFHRFVQADIENKSAYQGAGLGLSISKAYVELMGGNIWVESKLGEGSKFCFTIPLENPQKSRKTSEN